MAKSLIPPSNKPVPKLIPPSLCNYEDMEGDDAGKPIQGKGASRMYLDQDTLDSTHNNCHTDAKRLPNPTVVPRRLLARLHFTFLIRHPCLSIPSLYEISTPPVSNTTGWHGFHADDVGLSEMRQLFDYLVSAGIMGPKIAGSPPEGSKQQSECGAEATPEICVVDAEELLANPEKVCEEYCRSVGLAFDASMLRWNSAGDQERAERVFQKSRAQHTAALESASFKHSDTVRTLTFTFSCPRFSFSSMQANFCVSHAL